MPKTMTVDELATKLKSGQNFKLIDCRESDENAFCKIEGSILIPLSQFEELATQHLNKEDEIVVHCHHGGRSHRACLYLEDLGYENVTNLVGGIHAWSESVDPAVPKY